MLKMLVAYLSELGNDLDPKIVGRSVREVFKAKGDEAMATMAEKWMAEGIQRGIQQGSTKELQENILAFLVELKDPVPADLVTRIRGLHDPKELRLLLRKAARADSIEGFQRMD